MDERVERVINDPKTISVSIGVVSLGVGIGIGYILGRRERHKSYVIPAVSYQEPDKTEWGKPIDTSKVMEEVLAEQIADGKRFTTETLEDIVVVTEETGLTEEEVTAEKELEPVSVNIFREEDDVWDYDEELKTRTAETPYIIHKDEYYSDMMGYSQTTLTYYEGDDILADQEDAPIYNVVNIVGPLNFGHGSGDPNVFYVRNDKLKAEYEILRDKGLFSVEVMGLDIENNARVDDIKHSVQRKYKKD